MAEKATIARPYAQAAFDYAHAAGTLADWSVLLEAGAQVAGDERVARLLGSPHVTAAQLTDLFLEAARASDLPRRNFIATLAANGRLGLLPEIADQFARLRAEVENRVDVELVSALPVAAEQEKRLVEALRRRLGREVVLTTRLDAGLIGGAVVRAGDLVIDGSLRGRLERLASAVTA